MLLHKAGDPDEKRMTSLAEETGVGADGDKTVFIVLVACIASLLCMFIFFRYMSVNYFSSALQTSVSKAISELQNAKNDLSKVLTQFF